MPEQDNTVYQEKLKEIRQAFSAGLSFDESLVRPVILESWKRSRENGVRMGVMNDVILTEEELAARIRQRKGLCDVAFPILANLYEFTNGSGLLSVLCDEEGYVLKMVGQNYFDVIPPKYLLKVGCCRDERKVGTNGIGTVLAECKPMQVRGLEHFYPTFENYTCSGAPIFDADGKAAGVLCLAGPHENSKIHTLGLAIAIAEIISSAMKIDRGNRLLQDAYREVNVINKRLGVIFDTVSSGILLLDNDLNVVHANRRAAALLKSSEAGLAGRGINEFFDPRLVNLQSIARGIEDQYLTCEPGESRGESRTQGSQGEQGSRSGQPGQALELSVTIQPAEPEGYVVIFDTATALHKKISQVAGLDAHFTFGSILGQSPAIQTALEQARIAAQTPATVLLTGESGTGKELFAHAIHNASDRNRGPFVAINCGALPKSLIESELFGYEGGSFTGGKKEGQPGKFELAEGGTIFLDEIGDMPFDVQSTLLRVLQSREVVRVGGAKPKKIDVRIIAATNRNLTEAIQQQVFRADLFYRLNVFNIHVPSLRDRPGDIRILADYFIAKYSNHARKPAPAVTPGVYALLESFRWPGNVRELENVLERSIYVCDGLLDESALPPYLGAGDARLAPAAQGVRFHHSGNFTQTGRFDPAGEPVLRDPHAKPGQLGPLVPAGRHAQPGLPGQFGQYDQFAQPGQITQSGQSGQAYGGAAMPASGYQMAQLPEPERIRRAIAAAGGNLSRAAGLLGISRRTIYRKLEKHGIRRPDGE